MLDTHLLKREATGEPVVIYGAGIGGQIAVKELETNKDHRLKIIGFIDDNEELHGKRIMGYPVLGGGKDLKKIIEKYRVKKVLISFRKNGEEKKKELTSQFSKMRKQIDVYQMKLIIE
jgi:FlaA1/EpsC-like NDP-sugar epimerase